MTPDILKSSGWRDSLLSGRLDKKKVELAFFLSLTAALIACIWLLVWGETEAGFPNDDTVIYAVVAKLWSKGQLPYKDVVDHKPPMVYLFFRLCFWLGGLTPKALWQGYTALVGASVLALMWSFRAVSMQLLGISVGLAYAFFYLTDPANLGAPAFLNTELLASAFLALTLASLIIYRRSRSQWWSLMAGLTFGCAVLSKQPAAMFGLACFAHLATAEWGTPIIKGIGRIARATICFSIGALTPIFLTLGYFWLHGGLADLLYWAHSANIQYSAALAPFSMLRYYVFREHLSYLTAHLVTWRALPYCLGIFAVPLILLLRRSWIDLVALSWGLSALLSTATNIQGPHSHYHVFYQVPCALACGLTVYTLTAWITPRWMLRFASFVCLIAILFATDFSAVSNRLLRVVRNGSVGPDTFGNAEIKEFMRSLDAQAGNNPRILFYGPYLTPLFYSELLPTSKYIYNISGVPGSVIFQDFLESDRKFEPRVAFIGNYSPTSELADYLRRFYEPREYKGGGLSFVRTK